MEPGFWDDPQNAQRILQQAKQIKGKIQRYEDVYQKYEELNFFLEMAIEEGDASVEQEILEGLKQLEEAVEELKVETLLSGEYDRNNAILSIHAGAGDWMHKIGQRCSCAHTRWAERKGYRFGCWICSKMQKQELRASRFW